MTWAVEPMLDAFNRDGARQPTLEAQNFTKKRGLVANTNLRLNIPQISLPVWDENAIGKRGELLADAAVKVWAGPQP